MPGLLYGDDRVSIYKIWHMYVSLCVYKYIYIYISFMKNENATFIPNPITFLRNNYY